MASHFSTLGFYGFFILSNTPENPSTSPRIHRDQEWGAAFEMKLGQRRLGGFSDS